MTEAVEIEPRYKERPREKRRRTDRLKADPDPRAEMAIPPLTKTRLPRHLVQLSIGLSSGCIQTPSRLQIETFTAPPAIPGVFRPVTPSFAWV